MPIITFPYRALEGALARGALRPAPDRATLLEGLSAIGCAPDGPTDRADLSIESLMNRPDLFSLEGVARALRPFLGLGPSPTYPVVQGPLEFHVDPSVEAIRPEVSVALVRGVPLDEEGLARLIDTQEKLDLTYGRKRARVSIGLHDLAPLKGPITYKAVAPETASFAPLGAEGVGGGVPMSLGAILEGHPKGREYAHLLAGKPRFPLLVDSTGQVLSMPPIINGTVTQLAAGTRDIFLDVTGTSRPAVTACARLLAMLLADLGGTIESVRVVRPGQPATLEPSLAPSSHGVDLARASRLLGVPLRAGETAAALERLGHRASVVPGGAAIVVFVPPWRFDILHEADLVEDIAIGIGYPNLPAALPRRSTLGAEHALASARRRLRTALLGLGFLEVMTLTLTAPEAPGRLGASPASASTVAHPLSGDHSTLRTTLLPSLLRVLEANTHRELPQALFEAGDVVEGTSNRPRVSALYLGPDASFTRAKGVALALLESLGLAATFQAADAPAFTRGRAARALVGTQAVLSFGELAPETLSASSLAHPAFALELDLQAAASSR